MRHGLKQIRVPEYRDVSCGTSIISLSMRRNSAVAVVKAHPSFSFVHAMTSAMRPFVVPRAPHRTTTRSALQRTLPLRVRPFHQQSVEQTVLRTGKTTEHQTGGSARCQIWQQFYPCLDHHAGVHVRVVDLREALYCRRYDRSAEGDAAVLNGGRNRATPDTVTTGHALQTCNIRSG